MENGGGPGGRVWVRGHCQQGRERLNLGPGGWGVGDRPREGAVRRARREPFVFLRNLGAIQ